MPQDSTTNNQLPSSLAVLRKFMRPARPSVEVCELCGAELAESHPHLLELDTRQISCGCEACAILFADQSAKKFRRIPRRIRFLANFQLTDEQWNQLYLPINLAFFFDSTKENKTIALYPSPAGATESLLSLDSWREIIAANPILGKMESDVEALLINRVGDKREYFIAPVDECFKLVGTIRAKWRGLSGGAEVWQEIDKFFNELKAKATIIGEVKNA